MLLPSVGTRIYRRPDVAEAFDMLRCERKHFCHLINSLLTDMFPGASLSILFVSCIDYEYVFRLHWARVIYDLFEQV
jgi:hypothetical protein